MIKDFLLVIVARDVSIERAQHYLEFQHAPLALSVPALAREIKRYSMNPVIAGGGGDGCIFQQVEGLACIVEHDFGGWEGIQRFSADPGYLEKVRPDEDYMHENLMASAPQFVAVEEEVPVFTSPAGQGGRGNIRMFDFVRRKPSLPREAFFEQLEQDGQWAAAHSGYRAAVNERIHSLVGTGAAPFGGSDEPFDAVIETWIADLSGFANLLGEQRERRAAFCDPERSCSALTEEHRIIS